MVDTWRIMFPFSSRGNCGRPVYTRENNKAACNYFLNNELLTGMDITAAVNFNIYGTKKKKKVDCLLWLVLGDQALQVWQCILIKETL